MEEMAAAAQRHFSPETRDAAARLKILQELEGRNAPDAAAVGISQWAAELKARNNAFEALVKERDSEGASRSNVIMKEARKAADAAFKQLCDIINVYMVLEGEANYETFARTLNEIIARYKKKHHHHHQHHHAQPQQEVSIV
jgi:replicative superfamily II helicase